MLVLCGDVPVAPVRRGFGLPNFSGFGEMAHDQIGRPVSDVGAAGF